LEEALFRGVAEAGELDVEPSGPEAVDEAPDRLRTSHRHDRDALRGEIATAALRQSFERELVADALDEDDGAGGFSRAHRRES
jgi:hypothetical protein